MHQGIPHQSSYGFGGGGGPNPFSDYLEQTNQPWMSPDVSDETLRMLMGFVPVAGTAYNWDQMQPWERGLSMGLDAVDIATLGGGKAITAPIKAATRFATRGDPALTFIRGGDMPAIGAGVDSSRWQYPDYETYFDQALPPQGDITTSYNFRDFTPEKGVSVYQGLRFPWEETQGPNVFMKPLDSYAMNLLRDENLYSGGIVRGVDSTQGAIWHRGSFTRPVYEVKGNPLTNVGSDYETLLDPTSAQYVQKFYPPSPETFLTKGNMKELVRGDTLSPGPSKKPPQIEFRDFKELENNPWVTNPVSGESINLVDEFAKYNLSGQRANPFLRLDDIIGSNIKRSTLHPALPISLPGRTPMQIYGYEDNNQPPIVVMNRTGSIRDATYG